jgi:Chlorophyll A-B binding protein
MYIKKCKLLWVLVMSNENRNSFIFGFTPQAEIWNGRFAMLGFVLLLVLESATGKGLLARLGMM